MNIILNRHVLDSIQMRELSTFSHLSMTTLAQEPSTGQMLQSLSLEWNNFSSPAGQQHYRLLSYISNIFNNIKISDIGTSSGGSAMALASNQLNTVYSLDRVNCRTKDYSSVKNVIFSVGSFYDSHIMDEVVQSSVILLDIQHDGPDEVYFYQELTRRNWSGILICDDIHLNSAMRDFWSKITHKKFDVTRYGHGDNGSGTGIVLFGEEHQIYLE